MRIASLVPAATRILTALHLHDRVVACTHECGLAGVPTVSAAMVDEAAPSGRIDAQVRQAAREDRPVIAVEPGPLIEARPDVVFVQDMCDVCAVSGGEVRRIQDVLGEGVRFVALEAGTIDGMLEDIERVGRAAGEPEAAKALASRLASRRRSLARKTGGLDRPRVAVVEWLDPPFSAGHWVPEQVELAGGTEVVAEAGAASRTIDWSDVVDAAPEVVVLAPCGFHTDRTVQEAERLGILERLNRTPAVQDGRIFAVDADRYFSCAGPDLIDGAALLASLFHPDVVDRPPKGRDWAPVPSRA